VRFAVVQDRFTQYTTKLRQEIMKQKRWNEKPLQTVFFGGGTPSLIPPHQLEGILDVLHAHIGIDTDAEISMEADPGTFDVARLQEYMKLGVNRFSVGVQSFNEVRSAP
jgi:coproporphyrinogen III oxidase-like Fe-S oxidoreductase